MTAADGAFLKAEVNVRQEPDGCLILGAPVELEQYESNLGSYLYKWAKQRPEQTFLAQRDGEGNWIRLSYRCVLAEAEQIAAALLQRGLDPERPIMLLSGNSLNLARIMFGAMLAGIPFAPISPAYSLVSRDFGKLRHIYEVLDPGLIFVEETAAYSAALAALNPDQTEIVTGVCNDEQTVATTLTEILAIPPEQTELAPAQTITPETIVKILFTSGSTGMPKGVVNTHRMLCSNQQAIRQLWPFLQDRPPVIVDWLPWNHTFGGCHNFNLILCNGGTLYIDEGKPLPGLMEKSIANLKEVSPTLYFNVPAGFDALLPYLEADADLCRRFFSELDLIMYAAASLPQVLWDRLEKLSQAALGHKVPMLSGWGTTETAPLATSTYRPTSRAGAIGLPIPGTELKMVPHDGKYEIRVRGPNITPGYWKQPGPTEKAFDADGYYMPGDLVAFADADNPAAGILFKGRIAEEFKLSTGTWVAVGTLRVAVIEACAPLLGDIIVCGHDRNEIGALLIPNMRACSEQFADVNADDAPESLHLHQGFRDKLTTMLAAYNKANQATTTRIGQAMILAEPLSIDKGEVTDKGYINQGGVVKNHAQSVARLFSDHAWVIQLKDK